MKKLLGALFALVMAVAILPAMTFDAQAAEGLSGTYTDATIADGEYILDDDVSLSGSVSIAGEVTIDLNGKTLSGSVAPYFTVESTGKLTIIDSGTGGTIDGSTVPEAAATTSLLVVKGTLIQKGGDITGYTMYADGKYGMAVYADTTGTFDMYEGARITGNKLGEGHTGRGGAVGLKNGAAFTMHGGEISGNTAQYGGAIVSTGVGYIVSIHDGKITDNTATGGGSAIYLGEGSLTITGGEIYGNRTTTSTDFAMTVFTNLADFTMTGGVIGAEAADSNAAKSIRLKEGKARISGDAQILLPLTHSATDIKIGGLTGDASVAATSQIPRGWDETSKETQDADGNYVYTAQPLTYQEGWEELTEELAASGTLASGIYYLVDDVTLPVSVTTSGDVTLYLDGHILTGAAAPLLTVDTGTTLTINDRAGGFGQIKGIEAAGEMLTVNGKLVLQEGTLTGHNNTAEGTRDAGAVKLAANAEFVMNGGAITDNTTAGRGGAVLLQPGSSFTMNDGEISGNKAVLGGGIYCIGSFNSTSGAVTYGTINLYSGVIRDNKATYSNSSGAGGTAMYLQYADVKMSPTGLSEGTVIEGTGKGYTVCGVSSRITMSGGSIDAGLDTSAGTDALYLKETSAGVPSEAVFTGTAVVDGAGFNCVSTSTATIHDLRRLGKVTSKVVLTEVEGDDSVNYTQTDSVYSYYYDRPVDLRILSIGNSYSMDALNALAHVGDAFGLNIDAAYLYEGSCTIRRHAYGLANSGFEPYSSADKKSVPEGALYEYYRTDPATGDIAHQGLYVNVPYALAQEDWDIVTLHQGTTTVAFPGTFNSDIEFLTDYLNAAEPNADIYWYMTWSYDTVIKDETRAKSFKEHFDEDNRAMYNGIVDVINSNFAQGGTFHDRFAGWLPVGAAVQNMRELGYDHSMNRDGFHLSYMGGRFVASLTVLKTLYPELDLSQLKPEDLTFVATRSATAIADKFNVNDDLDLAVQAVNAAVAEAQTGRHSKLVITPAPTTVETVTNGASTTVAQTAVPLKPQFPSAEALNDGTVVVAAYENAAAAPKSDPTVNTWYYYCFEGAGRIVIWDGDGTSWNYDQPLFVIDQAQLEEWGISTTANRYARLAADTSASYTIFSDPRDPKLTAVTVDADNDGQVDDEMLLLTFWVRDYNNTETVERGTYMAYSLDGGASWQLALADDGKTEIDCRTGGDAAVFSDGSILMPYCADAATGALYLTWNPETGVWDETADRTISVPDTTAVDGSYTVDRIALASPDGETVYAFVGGSGAVLKSDDRGVTWSTEPVGNQDGLIGQPGLAVIDDNTLYATWTSTDAPYDTYGKVFTLSEGWDNSVATLLYDATGTSTGKNEAGYPTAVKLDSGDMLVVSYDANYRSVVGTAVTMSQEESMDVGDYKSGDVFKAPVKDGYVFAGWYTDTDHNEVYEAVTGSAYAKFVDKDVLSVKMQLSANTTDTTAKTDLRLLTSVDSVNYTLAGFKVTIGNVTQPISSTKVYKRIVANEGGVACYHSPDVFSEQSRYFMTYTITNVPNAAFDTEIEVVPYWVTLDGTEVTGVERSFTINGLIEAPDSSGLSSSTQGSGDSDSFEDMFGGNEN